MNNNVPFYKRYIEQLLYAIILPAFFLGFVLVYTPFSLKEYLQVGSYSTTFHYMMLVCIMMGVLLISRTMLHFFVKKYTFSWIQYILWCFCEVFAIAAFHALYATLFYRGELFYFSALANSIKHTYLILMYPYIIFMLTLAMHGYKVSIRERITRLEDSKLVKFYDDHKRLKLSISPATLLYLVSENNYVKICYLDNDKEKSYLLRSSMKALEETMSRCGLERCHRSYYVNPQYIRVLKRGKEGLISAELKTSSATEIPVSRQYFTPLSAKL